MFSSKFSISAIIFSLNSSLKKAVSKTKYSFSFKNSLLNGSLYAGVSVESSITSMAKSFFHSSICALFAIISS